MELINSSKVIVQKSKFFGYLYSLDSIKDIEKILETVSFENKKATHICYAAVFNSEEISKNDSEVGSPGKVLLQILNNAELKNHILIVARYFGGIKLGVGGVSRAFREAGQSAAEIN